MKTVPFLILACSLALPNLTRADWPLFRGDPLQTGKAEGTLPDPLEVRWKVTLGKE